MADEVSRNPRAVLPVALAAFAIHTYATSGAQISSFMTTAASTLTNTSALKEISTDLATTAVSTLKEISTSFTIGIISSCLTNYISIQMLNNMGVTLNSNMGAHTYTLDFTQMQNHWIYNDSRAVLGIFSFNAGVSGCAALILIRVSSLYFKVLPKIFLEPLRFF